MTADRPEEERSADGPPLLIAFGGLQQRVGGGHGSGGVPGCGGMPPHELVKTCERAGAGCVLFVRDVTRSWYLRGITDERIADKSAEKIADQGLAACAATEGGANQVAVVEPAGGTGSYSHPAANMCSEVGSFEAMVAHLRREVQAIRPSRLATVGSSMGGYAAIRAGIALDADAVLAFSPQVLLRPRERRAAKLSPMAFDDVLGWLETIAELEGFGMTPLTEAFSAAGPGCRTAVTVHVGSGEPGDVMEAELAAEAVAGWRAQYGHGGGRAGGGGSGGGGSGADGLCLDVIVHSGRDHNLVVDLRDEGLLEWMIRELVSGPATAGQAVGVSAPEELPDVATSHFSQSLTCNQWRAKGQDEYRLKRCVGDRFSECVASAVFTGCGVHFSQICTRSHMLRSRVPSRQELGDRGV